MHLPSSLNVKARVLSHQVTPPLHTAAFTHPEIVLCWKQDPWKSVSSDRLIHGGDDEKTVTGGCRTSEAVTKPSQHPPRLPIKLLPHQVASAVRKEVSK